MQDVHGRESPARPAANKDLAVEPQTREASMRRHQHGPWEGMRGETFTQDMVAEGTVKTEVKVQREAQGQDGALRELREEEGFCSGRGHMAVTQLSLHPLPGTKLGPCGSLVPLTDQHEVDPGSSQLKGPPQQV